MSGAFCVYLACCPETARYYLGKTTTAKIAKGYFGSGTWPKRVRAAGRRLAATIMHVCDDEQEALDLERLYVEFCRGDVGCMNFADGGVGMTTRTGRENARKFWDSPAGDIARARLKAWAADPVRALKRRQASAAAQQRPECKARVAETMRQRWADPAYVAVQSEKHLAAVKTASYREKLKTAHLKSWANPEIRARRTAALAARNKARALTPEYLAKLSAAQKKVWASAPPTRREALVLRNRGAS